MRLSHRLERDSHGFRSDGLQHVWIPVPSPPSTLYALPPSSERTQESYEPSCPWPARRKPPLLRAAAETRLRLDEIPRPTGLIRPARPIRHNFIRFPSLPATRTHLGKNIEAKPTSRNGLLPSAYSLTVGRHAPWVLSSFALTVVIPKLNKKEPTFQISSLPISCPSGLIGPSRRAPLCQEPESCPRNPSTEPGAGFRSDAVLSPEPLQAYSDGRPCINDGDGLPLGDLPSGPGIANGLDSERALSLQAVEKEHPPLLLRIARDK